jgi:hypothetical protein
LSEEEIRRIAEEVRSSEKLRSDLLDIDSYPLQEVYKRFNNMMYFIAGPSLDGLEILRRIIREAERLFKAFPKDYFKEGYAPRPKNSSGFMFITRPGEGRLKEAFLILESENDEVITAKTSVGVQKFKFDKRHFLPALRTPVGLQNMDVTSLHDYVAKEPYENMSKVMNLSGCKEKINEDYWKGYIKGEFERATTQATVVRRINPYSPNQSLLAFNSNYPLVVADLFHGIKEPNEDIRKAVVVLLNSIFSLAYIFCGKEETTGRYMHIRHHELYEMKLFPNRDQVERLVKVYEKYKDKKFPSIREQLDKYYDPRYEEFWNRQRKQETLIKPPPKVEPDELRLEFDLDVVRSIGSSLTKEDILNAYEAIVRDMIITRGLRRD